MCTMNPALSQGGTPFGPDGCQVPVGNGICGETRTLDIVNEFRRLYEEKLQQIDANGGGDFLQEKVRLQQEWIGDLTCQNEMLIKAVEDLEREAAERVQMLEQKLQSSAKCLCEVIMRYREYDLPNGILEEHLERLYHLENDQKNLLEFIRRIREENQWNVIGLTFFDIDPMDLVKYQPSKQRFLVSDTTAKAQESLAAKDRKINELQKSLDYLKSFGDIKSISGDLVKKKQECEALKKRMEETEHMQTDEITLKNDKIAQLKNECKLLEEKVNHADEQVAFRDNIIKDLRKEVKLLQQELRDKSVLKQKCKQCEQGCMNLMEENHALKEEIQGFGKERENNEKKCRCILEENDQLKCQIRELLQNLEILDKDKAKNVDNFKVKMESLANDNKKLTDEMVSLNHEVTQDEIVDLNKTIQDLQETLQRTKQLQEEEEKVKSTEIDRLNCLVSELRRCLRNSEEKDSRKTQEIQHLNKVVKQLVGNLKEIEEKMESAGKVCRICKGRAKVGFSENAKVQTEPDEGQRELLQKRDDIIQMQSEALSDMECRLNSTDCKETINELNEIIKKRDDIIRLQNDTLSAIQQELETTKGLHQQAKLDIQTYLNESETLKNEVKELQCALEDSRRKALDLHQLLKDRDEFIKSQNQIACSLHRELDALKAKLLESSSENSKNLTDMRTFQKCTCELAETFQCLETKSKCVSDALQERDDMIKLQTNLLNELQDQLESLTIKQSEPKSREQKHLEEIDMLKSSLGNRDREIELHTSTVKSLELELQTLRDTEYALKMEKVRFVDEIKHLKDEINHLKLISEDAEGRANNFQGAVDLYLNTINVLEASVDKYKMEISQQKATIVNLQEALVMAKREFDVAKQKTEESDSEHVEIISNCISLLLDICSEKEVLREEHFSMSKGYKNLQDINLDIEIDHCNSLQDMNILEEKVVKYQIMMKDYEAEKQKYKTEIKRLTKQKRCYEEVVVYFKEEMQLMADQLYNLQEMLTLSHETAQEESCKLYEAFINVQSTNEKLCCQLSAAEQKVLEEYQRNQLNAAKVSDLERLVSQKELDLGRHDHAIRSIRETLQCSLQQNEELHQTIVSLNETIAQLQHAIKKYEVDNCRSRENTSHCQAQINACKEKLKDLKCALDEKTQELCKLEMAYNSQNRCLRSAQAELQEMKEREKGRQCEIKCVVRDLKKQLEKSELKIKDLENEKNKLQQQLGSAARKDAVKDVELKRYRKVVGDLKKTLVDLNRSLTKKNFQCNNAECIKKKEKNDTTDLDDVCLNCPCEVEFYQGIVETLKKTVIDLKNKLTETQTRNEQLERDNNEKEAQQQEKDREYRKLRELLDEKMKKAQLEESRYLELAAQFQKEMSCMRRELELKTMQLDDVKKSCQEINSSRCLQLACAQEEVNNLKDELNNLLRKHCALNVENERLHSQSARMQNTVSTLEEKSQLLKGQLEQYLSELQIVQTEKESLVQKNRELLSDLRSLQCSYSAVDKRQSSIAESVKSLEIELEKVKCNRDEICMESKNIVGYFRDWLQEQKKINKYVTSREKNYWQNIEKMKEEYTDQCCRPVPPRTCRFNLPPCKKNVYPPPPRCHSSWSLGSQGTASMHESPCVSPCPNEESDWYSSTFRNDSEEEGEEDWVSKVEDLAAQVRRTNRIWKTKMESTEYAVCRDPNK
ncbi:unnamed protein product [Callosobruchus maculatus]|uniref:Uncharacterized protein n=1 Tax=Callosobruchus maculatus TaxID=64391 RepID=A0A653BLY7_CALMS|nr:unnamed protein product [Callosobruchus maculatus]